MKKIIKFLEQYDKSHKEAVTTNSLYFTYKGHQIRVSDHPTTRKTDIDIIAAFNDSDKYIIYLGGSVFPLVMSCKETISFLEHYFLLVDLTKAVSKVNNDRDDRVHSDDEDRASDKKWPFIYKYLKMDIPGYDNLSVKKKQVIRQLFVGKHSYVNIVSAVKSVLRTYPLTISANNFSSAISAKLAGINFHLNP